MVIPCDCCMVSQPMCALGEELFSSVAISANPAGLPITNLASTIDGTLDSDLSGFSPPVTEAQMVANPTTGFDYIFAAPVNGLTRLRWYNGGGGVLTDQDGFGLVTVTFLDAGLSPISSTPWDLTAPAGNNAVTRQLDFAAINGVARVRFDGFHKQNVAVMGTGSPLLRQVEAFTTQTVFACRRQSGVVEWYDTVGNLVPSAEVGQCGPANIVQPTPLNLTQVTMTESALGDDPGLGERMCNVVPPVTSSSGYTVLAGPCYDGSAGTDLLNWAGPLTSISMSYESGGNPGSGAALVNFSSPATGTITWPANGANMTVGEVRHSNLFPGGYATITYLAPAGSPASGSPRQDGGPNIRLGPAAIQAFTPYHFRIDFWAI